MPGAVFTDSYCMGQKTGAGLIFDTFHVIYYNEPQSDKQDAMSPTKIGEQSLQVVRRHQKSPPHHHLSEK